jgi:hypothetical protein
MLSSEAALKPGYPSIHGDLMPDKQTDRSNCRFLVKQAPDGRPFLAVQLYHDTIPALRAATIGFELLGGTRIENANKLADTLNEHVLEIFVARDAK